MADNRIYNFSAGPSMLPVPVLERCASEMLNYKGSGMSVMEMSHRSKVYDGIITETEAALRRVLSIPENYKVLFLQGRRDDPVRGHPNEPSQDGKADYAITGNFANNAYKEAVKFGDIHVAFTSKETGFDHVPSQNELDIRPDADYFYICANNTIYGTEYQYDPETPAGVPLVADMSSNILSKPVDVSKYGVIYAGAQKNMGPAGVTVVIVREDLLGNYPLEKYPVMLDWKTMADKGSMYNTPPTYGIYVLGLVLEWVEQMGGVKVMQERAEKRSSMLYDYLDSQDFYKAGCAPRLPQPHERHLPHGQRRAGREVCQGVRGSRHVQPQGSPFGRRHACFDLQRNADRGRRVPARLHEEVCGGERLIATNDMSAVGRGGPVTPAVAPCAVSSQDKKE